MQLDCNACKTTASMNPTKIGKFSSIVRTIAVLLLIPSFLGMGVAGLMLLSLIMSTSSTPAATSDAAAAGQAIGFGLVFVVIAIVGILSLVGGLLGWLLLLNRSVYKCMRCGFIIDRA
jgi:hypothetical protein